MKVAEVIQSLLSYADGEELPFRICVDDPSGNSFIQNPFAPATDPHMKQAFYFRSPEQDIALGLQPEKGMYKDDKESNYLGLVEKITKAAAASSSSSSSSSSEAAVVEDSDGNVRLGRSEVVSIPSSCPNCNAMGESLTALTDIPHFKELIIMAFTCGQCGYRNSEVKGGGAVPEFGTEVRLKVLSGDDLRRDVLKSDSAMVEIPELELELAHGSLGGVFTTVEGLLMKIHSSLKENNPFAVGDSSTQHHSNQAEQSQIKSKFTAFLGQLESLSRGENLPFTLVLRDPLGNSFVSAPLGSFLPPEMDSNLTMTDYARTFEDNEEFGLNDINTADYETGVSYDPHAKSDRLTQAYVRGPDHPTPFATAVPDPTPGGVYFGAGNASSSSSCTVAATAGAGEGFWDEGSKLGWRARKPDEREIDDDEQVAGAGEQGEEGEGAGVLTESDLAALGKRVFDEHDRTLQFDPREEFAGPRPGFVFRLGAMGLGYYEDKKKI